MRILFHTLQVLLAGGLNDKNVLDALAIRGVIGVDISSGLEADPKLFPGKKDVEKMATYMKKVRFMPSSSKML